MGTNHQQGVKKLQCRPKSLERCHIQLIWVQSLCRVCRRRKFPWAGRFNCPLRRWVDDERKGWVSGWSGWQKVRWKVKINEVQQQKKCKSRRELTRQNEGASVVSCLLSSLGLASSVSGFNLRLMINSREGWKSQIIACDVQTNFSGWGAKWMFLSTARPVNVQTLPPTQ